MKKIIFIIILAFSAASAVHAESFESLITEGDKFFSAGDYAQAEKFFPVQLSPIRATRKDGGTGAMPFFS